MRCHKGPAPSDILGRIPPCPRLAPGDSQLALVVFICSVLTLPLSLCGILPRHQPILLPQDLILMNYIWNNPVSKGGHILRYWRLGLEYILSVHTIQSTTGR